MFFVGNWRERPRNFTTSHYSVANYNTDIKMTADVNYSDDNFHNLHIIPDPFKKNLADQFVNPDLIRHLSSDLTSTPNNEKPMDEETNQNESTLSGITSFFSGVFNVLSLAMFRRGKSDNYQMASDWQPASNECKNGPSDHIIGDDIKNAMSDCRTAASSCEDKLGKVRLLLNSRAPSSPLKRRSRRPKRVFVEPNSIDEHFEDAFSSEDYINLVNESYMEYYSPSQYHSPDYFQVQSPVMHVHNKEVNETIKIRKYLPKEVNAQPDNVKKCLLNQTKENVSKDELITSCEDKLQQLKAMLQENRKKNMNLHTETDCTERNTKSSPIKIKDKRFKNPNRLRDKRKDAQIKQSIQDELHFAYELTLDESSFEESPSFHSMEKIPEGIRFTSTPDCFDEITGKFCNSNSSEDSFQIVFSDVQRLQKLSDCESEDSFIIFDNSPDNCYTSNDVFGDTDESDSDSDASDSECANVRLWRKLSETVSNLADDSVFTEDVVDFAKPIDEVKKTGLLIDDRRKKLKKSLPPKKVRFSSYPPKVHVMRVWAFAARQARAGHWERFAVDRERFKRRIADVDMAVSWVLKPQHRTRVVFQRFMPWWNAQKRKELEEIKQREEEQLADDGLKTEQLITEDLIGEQLKLEIENKEENSNEKEVLSADVVLKEVTHSEIENKDQLNSVVGNKNKMLIEEENEGKQLIVNAETSEKCSLKEEYLIYTNDNKEEKEEGRKKGMSYGDIEKEKMKN